MTSKVDTMSKKPDSILKQKRSQKQACKQRENKRTLAERQVELDEVILEQMPEERRDAIRECFNNMKFSEAQFEALLFGKTTTSIEPTF